MSQQYEGFRTSIQHGGFAFDADTKNEEVHLETTGWATRDGWEHLFVDGRTTCRKYVLTNPRTRLSLLPTGTRICSSCKRSQR